MIDLSDLIKIDQKLEINNIVGFIRKTFKETNKFIAVMGLSGGIDSAVSFALTTKALGLDRVHAYYLPSKTSNPQHLKDIQLLTSNFQLQTSYLHIIPIFAIIQKSWRLISHHTKIAETDAFYEAFQANSMNREIKSKNEALNKIRLANLTTRTRMMLLFDQAKKIDALVIGTENKSESQLGYFTRFGDTASDLEPIAHLYKTQVIELAKFLKIPESIINKPPSADLWTGQTDAAELGFTYTQADPILHLLSQNQSASKIIGQGFDQSLVNQVIKQVHRNQFKTLVPYRLDK